MGSSTPLNDPLFVKEFAARLKGRRQAYNRHQEEQNGKKITQQKAAALLGVTVDTIKGWEGGEFLPSLQNLARLCDLLNCDSDYLLGLSREPIQEFFDLQKNTGLSPLACAHIHNLQKIVTDYHGNQKEFGMKDVFDALASDNRFLKFLSECYMYMLTNLHYIESSVRAVNAVPKDRRYEKTRFNIAKGFNSADTATLDAQDAAKCHEMRALEIMKELLEDIGDFVSPILAEKYRRYFADNWQEAGAPTRIRMPNLPVYYCALEISEESLAEEFRLMIEAAKSTLNRKRKHVPSEQAAFMENEFDFLLKKLSFLCNYDAEKARSVGSRLANLYIKSDAHLIGFLESPIQRIAVAAGTDTNELLSAQPPKGGSV